MKYERPDIRDFGSLADHTFSGADAPRKDTRICTKDKFGEESCPTP